MTFPDFEVPVAKVKFHPDGFDAQRSHKLFKNLTKGQAVALCKQVLHSSLRPRWLHQALGLAIAGRSSTMWAVLDVA